MKKLYLLLVVASTLLTSGCFIKEKDLSQMFFPISLGITYEDNKYKVYLQVLNTSTISIVETEGSTNESTYILIHEEDEDINTAFSKLGLTTLTFISVIKLRSIIVHKSIFDEGNMNYNELFHYFINSPIFKTKVQMYVTDIDIEEFYSVKYNLVGTGIYSHASDKDPQLIKGFTKPSYLLDSLKSYYEEERMYHFPVMTVKEDIVNEGDKDGKLQKIKAYAYDGICFTTYSDTPINCLTKEEAFGYRWYNELTQLNVNPNNNQKPLNFIVDKVKWKTKISNNQFHIKVLTNSYININLTNLTLDQAEEELNNQIKADIEKTLKIAYEKDIDIYHLNDLALQKNKKLKYNLENVKITVDSNIKNTTYYKY